jgi:hypothetical protein
MIGPCDHQVPIADLACVFDALDGDGLRFLYVCRQSLPDLTLLFVLGGVS